MSFIIMDTRRVAELANSAIYNVDMAIVHCRENFNKIQETKKDNVKASFLAAKEKHEKSIVFRWFGVKYQPDAWDGTDDQIDEYFEKCRFEKTLAHLLECKSQLLILFNMAKEKNISEMQISTYDYDLLTFRY